MIKDLSINFAVSERLSPVLELAARVGRDPLLTQASTGNISVKADEVLWIKASGKWMADAAVGEFLIPLDLPEVRESIARGIDSTERYPRASIETAMHVTLPHRVVLHVHSVNTIAWAVREDAPARLKSQLEGLRWQWIPYVPSGLPLAGEIEKVLSHHPHVDLLVLGNHSLVLGADDCRAAEDLLHEVERRLAVRPREAHPADYALLAQIAENPSWELPDDDAIHALATDPASRMMLASGFLYPCQAIFSDASTPELFTAIPCSDVADRPPEHFGGRPFLIIEGRGVVLRGNITAAEKAMMSGLAQVIQRVHPAAALRYLTDAEVGASAGTAAYRYRELANASH